MAVDPQMGESWKKHGLVLMLWGHTNLVNDLEIFSIDILTSRVPNHKRHRAHSHARHLNLTSVVTPSLVKTVELTKSSRSTFTPVFGLDEDSE